VTTNPPTRHEDGDFADDEFPLRPWERQPGESPAAFTAFQTYRDLGPARSLDEVDRRLYPPLAGAPSERPSSAPRTRRCGRISLWSRQHRWGKRVDEWDRHVDREGRIAHIESVRAMNERHAVAARHLQTRALEALQEMPATDLAAADVLRFLVEACKLERLAVGEVTDRTATESKVPLVLEIVERIVPIRGDTSSLPAAAADPGTGGVAPVTHRLVGVLPVGEVDDQAAWVLPEEPPQFMRRS
jgi:hypothetical protein